jgi:hypothetical protein
LKTEPDPPMTLGNAAVGQGTPYRLVSDCSHKVERDFGEQVSQYGTDPIPANCLMLPIMPFPKSATRP